MTEKFTLPDEEEDIGLDSFPDEIQEDVEGLTWLGHLEESFEYCGHSFVIRTLKADEELEAALLAKDYMDTMGQAKAWAWSNISLALVSVDGEENFCKPAGPDRRAYATTRFKWCTSKWYWHVGEYIFAQYLNLLQRQLRAVDAVRDLSTRSLLASSPFADFSTDQGDSESPPILAVMDEDED